MKNVFTHAEVRLIMDILDDINDDHGLSFLYSQIGHKTYAYWFDEVYDKLESYSPLTPFCLAEINLILDALQTLNNIEDSAFDRDILSVLRSACIKAERIRMALSPKKK